MSSTSNRQGGTPARSTLDPATAKSPLLLTASQEGQVRDLYYKRVRQKCADEIREFATCAMDRTFTATFVCRTQQKAMNQCMMLHATQEEHDAARTEWFATIDQRHEERIQKKEKRDKDEKFWRDWWDRSRYQKKDDP